MDESATTKWLAEESAKTERFDKIIKEVSKIVNQNGDPLSQITNPDNELGKLYYSGLNIDDYYKKIYIKKLELLKNNSESDLKTYLVLLILFYFNYKDMTLLRAGAFRILYSVRRLDSRSESLNDVNLVLIGSSLRHMSKFLQNVDNISIHNVAISSLSGYCPREVNEECNDEISDDIEHNSSDALNKYFEYLFENHDEIFVNFINGSTIVLLDYSISNGKSICLFYILFYYAIRHYYDIHNISDDGLDEKIAFGLKLICCTDHLHMEGSYFEFKNAVSGVLEKHFRYYGLNDEYEKHFSAYLGDIVDIVYIGNAIAYINYNIDPGRCIDQVKLDLRTSGNYVIKKFQDEPECSIIHAHIKTYMERYNFIYKHGDRLSIQFYERLLKEPNEYNEKQIRNYIDKQLFVYVEQLEQNRWGKTQQELYDDKFESDSEQIFLDDDNSVDLDTSEQTFQNDDNSVDLDTSEQTFQNDDNSVDLDTSD